MSQANVDNHIESLLEAHRTGKAVPPASQSGSELTIEEAFAVQAAVAERRADGASTRIRAFKAGLADPPFTGRVLAHDVVLDGGTIDMDFLVNPLVEPEVAFVFGAPLSGRDLTVADVLRATDFVLPAYEIIDRRLDLDGDPARTDILADNGYLGRAVLGASPVAVTDLDLAAIQVDLHVDGQVTETGRSNRAAANPAHAVVLMARLLDEVGLGFEPGQALLTGSCTAPYQPRRGTTMRAEFEGLGDVSVNFA